MGKGVPKDPFYRQKQVHPLKLWQIILQVLRSLEKTFIASYATDYIELRRPMAKLLRQDRIPNEKQ